MQRSMKLRFCSEDSEATSEGSEIREALNPRRPHGSLRSPSRSTTSKFASQLCDLLSLSDGWIREGASTTGAGSPWASLLASGPGRGRLTGTGPRSGSSRRPSRLRERRFQACAMLGRVDPTQGATLPARVRASAGLRRLRAAGHGIGPGGSGGRPPGPRLDGLGDCLSLRQTKTSAKSTVAKSWTKQGIVHKPPRDPFRHSSHEQDSEDSNWRGCGLSRSDCQPRGFDSHSQSSPHSL